MQCPLSLSRVFCYPGYRLSEKAIGGQSKGCGFGPDIMSLALHCLLSVCTYVQVPLSYKDISSIPLSTSPTVFSLSSENTLCPKLVTLQTICPCGSVSERTNSEKERLAWPHGFNPQPLGYIVSGPVVRQTTMWKREEQSHTMANRRCVLSQAGASCIFQGQDPSSS